MCPWDSYLSFQCPLPFCPVIFLLRCTHTEIIIMIGNISSSTQHICNALESVSNTLNTYKHRQSKVCLEHDRCSATPELSLRFVYLSTACMVFYNLVLVWISSLFSSHCLCPTPPASVPVTHSQIYIASSYLYFFVQTAPSELGKQPNLQNLFWASPILATPSESLPYFSSCSHVIALNVPYDIDLYYGSTYCILVLLFGYVLCLLTPQSISTHDTPTELKFLQRRQCVVSNYIPSLVEHWVHTVVI